MDEGTSQAIGWGPVPLDRREKRKATSQKAQTRKSLGGDISLIKEAAKQVNISAV